MSATEQEQFPENPEPNYGEWQSLEAIKLLDDSQRLYLEACDEFATHLKEETLAAIQWAAEVNSKAYYNALMCIMHETPLPEFIRVTLGLTRQLDKQRVESLNKILGKDALLFADLTNEVAPDDQWDLSTENQSKAQYVAIFSQQFANDIAGDTEEFLNQAATGKRARRRAIRNQAINHAIDITKMAAGSAIGIWIMRQYYRK